MTREEFDWLNMIERNVDRAWDDLTAWEQDFIENLLERFRRYARNTKISKKEWEVITRISEKVI